jgi:UDP-N-acetylglucosamine 2-epimerase (non-hydrolysing)
MRIAYVLGARPNFVKMAPVIADLRKRMPDGRHTIVHTGQHYDKMMSDIFLEELGWASPTTCSAWARPATPCRPRG